MSRITPFKAWMFGLAIAASVGLIVTGSSILAYSHTLADQPLIWLLSLTTSTMWIGVFAAIVRDQIMERLDDRNDRCKLVQNRLDEIEQEHADDRASLVQSFNGGRRLHTVE